MTSIEINSSKSDESDFVEEANEDIGNPEIDSIFTKPYYLEAEEAISLEKNYVLHMSSSSGSSGAKIAVSLSDFTCSVYNVDQQLKTIMKIPEANDTIINVRFSPESDNLLYTGSADCLIKLWDLRQNGKCVNEYKDKTERRLSSFDISCNGRFLCGGTEVVDGDAFLLFWDVRSSKLLGGYWDSHTDIITQVCYHPSQVDSLATGSTDGLINIFDVSLKTEADALIQTLNTESSVERLFWHETESKSILSCITHMNDLQLWDQDGGSPYRIFSRSEMASVLKITTDNLYIANVNSLKDSEELMVLAGSNAGKGECLRSASIIGEKVRPLSTYSGNKQIVRCSWYNQNNDSLITGGETGLLSLWLPGQASEPITTKLKINKRQLRKPHKSKPY